MIQLAFLQQLPSLEWMAAEDKLAAADKLAGMVSQHSLLQSLEALLPRHFVITLLWKLLYACCLPRRY